MRPRRFKADHLDADQVTLSPGESRHAARVLRLGPGDRVILFDGRGVEADAEILSLEPDRLTLRILTRRAAAAPIGLTLLVCPPRGERADWLIEKCAELGVDRIIPILCERGVVRPGEGKLDRWQRKADEAAKQCERPRGLRIDPPAPLADALAALEPGAPRFYGDPRADAPSLLDAFRADGAPPVVIIGPEGGLTGEEIQTIESGGGAAVRLADTILRVETAAIAAASLWAAWSARRE